MVGPDFERPCPPDTETYTESKLPSKTVSSPVKQGKAQTFAFANEVSGEWWTLFRSPELNSLIEAGIANSPNLEAAAASLCQSQEIMKAYVGSALFPAVDGQLGGQRQKINEASIGAPNIPPQIFNLYNASINVSYTLDFFGGARRKVESLCAGVEYQSFLLEAAYLTLTANIVTTAITEASLRGQIQATNELIDLNQQGLNLIKQQFELGAVSKAAVLAQETQLEQVKATLPDLEKNLAITRHSLAILIGSFPSDNCLPNFYLNKMQLPTELPVSLPSQLVQQRPDIRAAEALLHQASAEVGVSTANLYPNITLTGSYGYSSEKLSDMFKNISNVWNYGGQLLQPIFHGGSLRANRRASIDAFDQALAKYKQAVLVGFKNVADSLRALEMDAKTLKAQTLAEKAAADSLKLVQQQFKLGSVNYLALLDAERQYQLVRINRIKAQAARLNDTAALFQAMGGGWWNREC